MSNVASRQVEREAFEANSPKLNLPEWTTLEGSNDEYRHREVQRAWESFSLGWHAALTVAPSEQDEGQLWAAARAAILNAQRLLTESYEEWSARVDAWANNIVQTCVRHD